MIVGCFTLELYCDSGREQPYGTKGHKGWVSDNSAGFESVLPDDYAGETRAECVRQAKRRGWVFKRDGKVICPMCAKSEISNV